MHKLFDIEGKKAIVTGGTRGLGYGMAEGLMEAGCEVVIVGTSDKVYDVAKGFCDRGFKCHGVKADLSKRQEVFKCFDDCLASLGGDLDILVTAHGIQRRHSAEVFPENEWDEVINVNLNSVFFLCQKAANVMLKKGYGKIITIASMVSAEGPMNMIPSCLQRRANSAFSDRKPYPGCMASAWCSLAALMILSMFR